MAQAMNHECSSPYISVLAQMDPRIPCSPAPKVVLDIHPLSIFLGRLHILNMLVILLRTLYGVVAVARSRIFEDTVSTTFLGIDGS